MSGDGVKECSRVGGVCVCSVKGRVALAFPVGIHTEIDPYRGREHNG